MNRGKMRVVRCTGYRPPDVLELVETEVPAPKENELRIAVKASAVTASDIFIRSSDIPPSISNTDAPSDRYPQAAQADTRIGLLRRCRLSRVKNRALQYMEKGNIQPNQHVLIYGASGTSGTIAVQYAKYLGARVTGVCSTKNLDFVESLGADTVIDYTTTDSVEPGVEFDFVLDSVGKIKNSPLKQSCKNAVRNSGSYVSIDNGDLILSSSRLDQISTLVVGGAFTPVVEKSYPLEQIVAAHKYVQKGHKRGGVAIRISE